MNYYIIPTNHIKVNINMQVTNAILEPQLSYSLIFYMNNIYEQLIQLQDTKDEMVTINFVNKIVNPFEFIYTNVPGSTISVSKVKPDAIIFFELMEIFQVFNIIDELSFNHTIHIAHFTHNYTSTNYLLNMLREENEDTVISEAFHFYKLYNLFIQQSYKHKLDLIICEFQPNDYTDTKQYIYNIILVLLLISKYQMTHGMSIIKIDNILYKPIIDVIFILSSLYDKMYLIKPSISNITTTERYLICKGFNARLNYSQLTTIETQLTTNIINNKLHDTIVNSVIDNELPYYLLNKLNESNLVIGQQQIEAYDQIIHIFKNKNREERIENLKKTHIQKCIQWCEKNQLPHNKFIDKVNIFLTSKQKVIEDNILPEKVIESA